MQKIIIINYLFKKSTYYIINKNYIIVRLHSVNYLFFDKFTNNRSNQINE